MYYEGNYSGWESYVSNYFYSFIWLEGLLCDAECNLLAIAKFIVMLVLSAMYKSTIKTALQLYG